jgi:undecaprenyl phosphate-alpha-L-ara4N flippase subunit ArnE
MNDMLIPLVLVPLLVGVGQILFKLTSERIGELSVASGISLFLNPWFLAALALYGAATIAWVFVLKAVPVGRAYLFMSLTFVVVPIGGWIVFDESLGTRQLVGIAIIIIGITVAST